MTGSSTWGLVLKRSGCCDLCAAGRGRSLRAEQRCQLSVGAIEDHLLSIAERTKGLEQIVNHQLALTEHVDPGGKKEQEGE